MATDTRPSITRDHPSIVCDALLRRLALFGFQQPACPPFRLLHLTMSLTRSDSRAKENFLSDKPDGFSFFSFFFSWAGALLVLPPDKRYNMTAARRHLHTRKYPPTHHETPVTAQKANEK